MQQDALVLGADVQHLTGFLGVPSFHVAQQNDRALAGGQAVDHGLNMIPELPSPDDPLRAQFVPQFGRFGPMTVGFEFAEGHAALGGGRALHQRAQSDEASLAGYAGSGTVHDNAENPGHEAGAPFEAANPRIHGQPRILHNLLGLGVASDDGRGEPDEGRMETTDQKPVSYRVALAQSREKPGIVEFCLTHRTDGSPGVVSLRVHTIWRPSGVIILEPDAFAV